MLSQQPQLQSHKGLRGEILHRLKRAQPLTANELAQQLGVSSNAIRHHLNELALEGLVVHGRQQRGVGAPTFAYRLSEAGEVLFPRRYEETLTDLLARLEAKAGRAAVAELLEERYAALARRLAVELGSAAPAERLDAVTRLMNDGGYMAEWTEGAGDGGGGGGGGQFRLLEHNCAIRALAQRFPEVCAAEERFLVSVLGAEVHRAAHIASGCNACEYIIAFPDATNPGRQPGVPGAPETR
jgi:DeoR family transcriptional regulator, suf operon transcriptional repressor